MPAFERFPRCFPFHHWEGYARGWFTFLFQRGRGVIGEELCATIEGDQKP